MLMLARTFSFPVRRSGLIGCFLFSQGTKIMPTSQEPSSDGVKDQSETPELSKKAAQKAAKKAERLAKQLASLATSGGSSEEVDLLACNYGDLKLEAVQSKEVSSKSWAKVSDLNHGLMDQTALIRGFVHSTRGKGKIAFVVVREGTSTVQCVASFQEGMVSKGLIKYVSSLNKESVVDVEGVVVKPQIELTGTTQQVELQVRRIYCVSKAASPLPFNIEDAARSDQEIEKGKETGEQYVSVLQDTRLNNRFLDLRTPANQGIFRVQSSVSTLFRDFLLSREFIEIHTPKLMAGASEGGASVFKLEYLGQPACLAQSPQLHKQMAICAGFGRVFEVGSIFRAENSFTHRHLCEFVGLDFEMEIHEHYFEVLDLLSDLFLHIFEGLNKKCAKELEAINRQYPFEPMKYLKKTLRLTFEEGVEMLKEAGIEVDPFGDLSTETERRLGQLVKEKYGTDFYILHRYPLAVRPFYTMPAVDDLRYTNSFDVFIRGEEIISGAQRVHEPELLIKRAEECGIDISTLTTYIDAFRCGAPPHGGVGVGLERVVMLFCGLNNIRKTSLFPRDPKRLAP